MDCLQSIGFGLFRRAVLRRSTNPLHSFSSVTSVERSKEGIEDLGATIRCCRAGILKTRFIHLTVGAVGIFSADLKSQMYKLEIA